MSLVHFVARGMAAKARAVAYDDLVSAGSLGLLAAFEGYDPALGFAFSTYAVKRIRAAMLDDLRRQDWAPRASRSRGRMLDGARARVAARLQRGPSPGEIAGELGVELAATYWRWCDELPARAPVSLDSAIDPSERPAPAELIGSEAPSAEQRLMLKEDRARVRQAITELPERDQRVLALYYYEQLTLKEVGEVLGVTESRVSQLRQRALQELGRVLQR